jgi:hypothetical protein
MESKDEVWPITRAARHLKVTEGRFRHLAAQARMQPVRTAQGIAYQVDQIEELNQALAGGKRWS